MTTISSFTRAPEGQHYDGRTGANSLLDADGNPDFSAIRVNPDFIRVRRRLIRFTVPAVALFLGWYMTYVLLAAYAHGLMSTRVVGSVTVGLLLGLSQFVTTVVIMLVYLRFTRKKVDPEVTALRERAGLTRS